YRVFIDLDKPAPTDNREYVFRVITPSQPWGYQWTDNTKALTADNKRKAMESYRLKCGVSDPFQESAMEMLFPFDASLPVPFEIFIEAAIASTKEENIVNEILKWLHTNSILIDWLDEIEKIKADLKENSKSKKKLPELNSLDLIKSRI